MFMYFLLIILLPGMGEGKPCSSWNSCRNCVSREQCIFVQQNNFDYVCVSRSASYSEYRRVFRTRSRCVQLENGLTSEKPALEKYSDSRLSENIPSKESTTNVYNWGELVNNSKFQNQSGTPEIPQSPQEPIKVQNRESSSSSASIIHAGKSKTSSDITPHSPAYQNSIGVIIHEVTSQSTKPPSGPFDKLQQPLNITTQLLSFPVQENEVKNVENVSSESTTSTPVEKLQQPLNTTTQQPTDVLDSEVSTSQPTSKAHVGKLPIILDITPQPQPSSMLPTEITDIEVQSSTPLQNMQGLNVLEPITPPTTLKMFSEILQPTEIAEEEIQSSTPQQIVRSLKVLEPITTPTTPKVFSEIQLPTSIISEISIVNTIRAINNERLQREIIRSACKLSLQQKGYQTGMGDRWFKMSIVNPMGTKHKKCRRLLGKSSVQMISQSSTNVAKRQKRKQLRKTACELAYLQRIYLYSFTMGKGWFAMSLANPMRSKSKECSRILRKRILL